MTSKIESLSRISLFAGLTETELQALASRAVERRYEAGEVLFWEGEPCAGIFLVVEGSVKIFKTSPGGREMMLSLETAPASVAELPLFDGGPYPASVRAVEAATTLFVNKGDFQLVCRQYPDVALKVLAVVGRRLRQLVMMVESMTFGSVTQRLARVLLETAQQAGSSEFEFPLTHAELASRLGTVREVVSRNLGRFKAEGLLRVEGRQFAILDVEGMQREAEASG